MTQTSSDLQAVVAALREHDRFLVVTHENPDGDALGSLLATTLALRQLGKDVIMYLAGDGPLPREYAFMSLDGLVRELPADMEERVLVAVDCAKADRMGPDTTPIDRALLVIDIDHHHDNSRFGDINLIVADASSTGEVLRDVVAELGVELDVSAIARTFGGGGHRQAAGFSSEASIDEITELIRQGFVAQRAASRS